MPACLPPTFSDHPAIRGVYIRAFVNATFHKLTRSALRVQLDGDLSLLQTLSNNGVHLQGLDEFALTLPTIERRLGVSTDGFIVYLFACPTCWTTYQPSRLYELTTASCLAPNCDGRLYTTKRASDGKEKRTPGLTVPFVRPSSAIARKCLQPGKVAQWQQWRGAGDEPGVVPPTAAQGYDAFPDPDKPMTDVSDGWAWRAVMAGLQRRRSGAWEVRDIDALELNQRFVSLPNGLLLQINIDWFQAVKGACHSTGALYTTILNNPRGIRNLREETQLTMMFPGPHEPTLKQQNNVMREFVNDIALLYDGIILPVVQEGAGLRDEYFHASILNDNSDLPASRKTSAIAGCTSIFFMCPNCPATFYSLTSATCFDRSTFVLRDPWRYLKYSFRYKELGPDFEEEIFTRRGIRHAVTHELPNWMPGITGVIDFMHCVYLCMVKHLCKDILLKTGMIDAKASAKLEEVYEKLIWPPSVSRMPPSISRGAGSIKADNWKTQIIILYVALFDAWQVDGKIPDGDAPLPAANSNQAKALDAQQRLVWKRMKAAYRLEHPDADEAAGPSLADARMDRSYRKHYDTILQFSAALRILSSHKISPNDVKRGCSFLSRAVQAWARMHCHLTPYFHLAMHFEAQFYRFGPCTGWWTYPYERNNGFLGRFNTNGHSGGELECTMIRGWWKTLFIQDLITFLESLPAPRAREDTESIKLLKDCLRGGTSERQSSFDSYQARVNAALNPNHVRYPKQSRQVNLHTLGPAYYRLVYQYLRRSWSADLDLILDSDMLSDPRQSTFFGNVRSFAYLWVNNRRHGAATSLRGSSSRFTYIDNRIPVQVEHLFEAEQAAPTQREPVRNTFAIVRRFLSDAQIVALAFPWDLWATDLGVRTWRADVLGPAEVVSVLRLTGHFVVAPLRNHALELRISVPIDTESPEDDQVDDM
ncbi:hypothetical protein K523DRAFT_310242 [Schizophyllum commune Tattone D]|nr:hypothetical protein K523DRAFT_310242 [Schizophyllum commune Tattone D]